MSKGYKTPAKKREVMNDSNLSYLTSVGKTTKIDLNLDQEISMNRSWKLDRGYDAYGELELNQHIIELWTVLRKIAKIVFISTVIVLIFPGYSNGSLMLNPYKPAVLQILNLIIAHSFNSFLIGENVQIFIGSPLTPIEFYLYIGFFISFLISLPIIIKEGMSFIRPGLTDQEYDVLKRIVKIAAVLFLIGSFLSYFIIMPVTLRILTASGGVIGEGRVLQMYSLDSILKLLLWGTLGGGLLYASPVIFLALIDLDIIGPDQIANQKREIMFAIFVFAAIITPDPTIISMLILSIPMIFILEFIITMGYKIEFEKMLR